jgi:adenosylmethionine-8-amino-7-oxononanoate aminotransferase
MDQSPVLDMDKKFVWHPCTQMKDHEIQPPIEIVRGEGSFLFARDGKQYIDGISSWWVNLLGHCHPRLTAALQEQAGTLEHVIFAGFTHQYGAQLAAELCRIAPGNPARVFYADCGSAAVEVALKMSFQYWKQTGNPRKTRFVSLSGAYHGETLGALSVGGIGLYRQIYEPLLLDTVNAPGPECFPNAEGTSSEELTQNAFAELERIVSEKHQEIAAVCIEPLIQCANNMNMYGANYLVRLRELCTRYDIHLIADEIAVGFGRTGKLFACEHAGIVPDFLCLSKGLTGGYMPFSAVVVQDEAVYDAFYGEYTEYKAFYHSHSYTGNPMACRIALEVIDILENEVLPALPERIAALSAILDRLGTLEHVCETRQCGFVGAVELVETKDPFKRYDPSRRTGWQIYREALTRGAFLRPLGDVIYMMTPLTIPLDVLEELGTIAYESIKTVTEQ